MITPIIHLNGTDGKVLLEQVCSICDAIRATLTVMSDGWPNGRDYYPLGSGAMSQADAEWTAHTNYLHKMLSEFEQLAVAIDARRIDK